MSRIVVVEDDAAIAAGLAMNLRREGHDVRVAPDGIVGLEAAGGLDVDLVVLDVMLPGLNGYDLLRQLRERHPKRPVLMLSARGREGDRVLGLDLGADDYVTKPFSLAELLARIRALLRRTGGPRSMELGDVAVDFEARQAFRNGASVGLTAQEFRLLTAFVEAEGRVLTRELLLNAAWDTAYDGTDRTVDTFVRQLRVKLEADPERPRHLVTVRGAGYLFTR
jgi:two-component system alkaline phosphatase synthesis response regulator PhoP